MPSPFSQLGKPKAEELIYDEWEGQFDCDTIRCNGYAFRAKYFKKERRLAWECQEGHISVLENVAE